MSLLVYRSWIYKLFLPIFIVLCPSWFTEVGYINWWPCSRSGGYFPVKPSRLTLQSKDLEILLKWKYILKTTFYQSFWDSIKVLWDSIRAIFDQCFFCKILSNFDEILSNLYNKFLLKVSNQRLMRYFQREIWQFWRSDRYFYQIYKKFDIPHFLFVSHVNIHFTILCAPGLQEL